MGVTSFQMHQAMHQAMLLYISLYVVCCSQEMRGNRGDLHIPDSKVYAANMGPTWDRQDPGGSHVGPMNLAIWDVKITSNYHLYTCPTICSLLVKLNYGK